MAIKATGVFMYHKLFLLRHAKSDWSSRCHDQLRPLNDRGRRDANTVGNWFREQDIYPDKLISSPAERCIQTCHYLLNGMQSKNIKPDIDERLYLANSDTIEQIVVEQPESRKAILLIAHNPGLDDFLLANITTPLSLTDKGKLMTTATLAVISFSSAWSQFKETDLNLDALVRTKDLTSRT